MAMGGEDEIKPGWGKETLRLFTPFIFQDFKSGYSLSTFRKDFFGGLTSAVVALPLALAFGVSSGIGASAGLYGAIAVGFFAALFGGTRLQVSGPTGPMTVVMAAVVASHAGNLGEAFAIVALGGFLQIFFGLLRVGKYIIYTPYSVVSGFMTGIGVIIIVTQLPFFLGLDASTGGVIGAILSLSGFSGMDMRAATLAALALAAIVLWPDKLRRMLPAPLVVICAGTLAAVFFVPGLPEIGIVPQGLPSLTMPAVTIGSFPNIFQAAFVLALLGGIDSLLTSLVADSVARTNHDPNKELIGQGIGNLAAGFIGGLPGSGATMRTLINIRAGAQTSLASIMHALVLLTLLLGLAPLVTHVPYCVLAAILIKVGWDIIDWEYLKRMRKAPGETLVIMLVTFGLTVFVDLVTAVAVGIIIASFVNARWIADEQIRGLKLSGKDGDLEQLTQEEKAVLQFFEGKILVTLLTGSYSYASARELARRANGAVTNHSVVVYDFTHAGYIDTSAALAIDEVISLSIRGGRKVFVSGLRGRAQKMLDGLGILKQIPHENRYESRIEAIVAASQNVKPD